MGATHCTKCFIRITAFTYLPFITLILLKSMRLHYFDVKLPTQGHPVREW